MRWVAYGMLFVYIGPRHNIVGYLDLQRYFYASRVTKQERRYYNNHPGVKPIALMKWLIEIFAPDNGIVLDPFMGTGLAALQAGRRFVGIEMSQHYINIARE
jgi:site-specific DNA-methyltransferase (adenine-specific)